ncbi:kinase-like domain-containing protein [Cyathus striatus]|nr:kinase-like domain-containing protein [Cyathus striatus]
MKKTRQSIRRRVSSLLTSLGHIAVSKDDSPPPTKSNTAASLDLNHDRASVLEERISQLESQVSVLSEENRRLRDSETRLQEALTSSNVPDTFEHDSTDRAPSPEVEDFLEPPVRLRRTPTIESLNTAFSIIRCSRISDLSPLLESDESDGSEDSESPGMRMASINEDDTSTNATVVVDNMLPSSIVPEAPVTNLSGCIERKMDYPLYGGGHADVHVAVLKYDGEEKDVAVKVIRAHTYREVNRWKIDKRLRREVRVWACLNHPNIVPLLGITRDFGPYTSMVCPWMEDGDLHNYLKDNRATLTLSTRLKLLADITEGLCYLHTRSIVHGDLTTANILIDKGKACLSDFGLSNILPLRDRDTFISSTVGGAVRWAAPELYRAGLDSAEGHPEISKPCDIYSFGNIMLHTISGQIPYANISSDVQVMFQLMKGNHPWRPPEPCLTDAFWLFMTLCWKPAAYKRPDIRAVLQRLHDLSSDCNEDLLRSTLVLDVEPEAYISTSW